MRGLDRGRVAEVAGVIALLCAAALVTRAAFFGAGFLNVDEGAHMTGARELAEGARLYVDFADNKPPLVYVYYALARALFGAGPLGARLFTALFGLPAIAACAAAFFGFDRRGRAAGIAFLVASAALLPSDAHAINGEHILLVPLAASVVLARAPGALARPERALAIGALVGLASLAKQPAALCGAAFAWSALGEDVRVSRRAMCLALLAVGFALPHALVAAIFARQGALEGYAYWVYRYNLQHVSNPITLGDRVIQLLEMGSVLIPALGPLAIAWAWGAKRGAFDGAAHQRRLVAGLAITTLLPAFLGWRLFGHYFIPFVFALSLGAGPFLAELRGLPQRILSGVLVAGCVAFTIAGRVVHDPARGLTDINDPRYAAIATSMKPSCAGERPLFVWGYAPQVYVESGLRPASRFVVPIDTISGHIVGNDSFARGAVDTRDRIVPEHWDRLMEDLARSRPEYIVDTAPADLNHWGRYPISDFARLDAFVRDGYRRHATIGGALVWRRADCP